MLENGSVDCAGEKGTACEFTVVSAAQGGSAIKLRNVAQPHFYLGIVNGYFVGYVSAHCNYNIHNIYYASMISE